MGKGGELFLQFVRWGGVGEAFGGREGIGGEVGTRLVEVGGTRFDGYL